MGSWSGSTGSIGGRAGERSKITNKTGDLPLKREVWQLCSTATSYCATGSETNRGRGDRHDPGQDDRTGNPPAITVCSFRPREAFSEPLIQISITFVLQNFKEFCFTIL